MSGRPVYLAATGMVTAIGGSTEMVCAAAKAGISRFSPTSYFTRERHQIVQALVPDACLPPLAEAVAKGSRLSFREKRMLRMSQRALAETCARGPEGTALPLLLAAPEVYPGVDTALSKDFIPALSKQSGLPVDASYSRVINLGRAGIMEAVKLAENYLYDLDRDYVLIGGCDSYQHSPLLRLLDSMDRVAAQRVVPSGGRDDFIPGEAAGFLLLSRLKAAAITVGGRPLVLDQPGFAQEPAHWFSDEPYTGEGLTAAFQGALENINGCNVRSIYSSLNGENYWAKELGVALTRCHAQLAHAEVFHPAEFWGDTGAAAGPLQIALAARHSLHQSQDASLIYGSSDQGYRGAVLLKAEG